jgi:hypothetical protein
MGQVLRGKGLRLDHPFQIHGQVSFTGEGLSRSLARPRWQGLGDALGEALLGIAPLTQLWIQAGRLVIAAQGVAQRAPIQLETELRAAAGSVEIRSVDGVACLRLPMDANISIHQAGIEAGMVRLAGQARVCP